METRFLDDDGGQDGTDLALIFKILRPSLQFLSVVLLLSSLAACQSSTSSSNDIQWHDPVTVSEGRAIVGPWRMNRSVWKYVDDPHVDLYGNQRTAVAWVNQGRKDIFFQTYDSNGKPVLDKPTNVSGTPGVFSWFPDVVVGPQTDPRHVYVLWQEIVFSGGSHGGEIFFSRSTDGGKSFEKPINLSQSRAGDGKGPLTSERWDNGSLELSIGPDGSLYAVWTEYEGNLWFSRSTNDGRTFSNPKRLAGGSGDPARGPSLAVEENGDLHLVWTVGYDNAADIKYVVLDRHGRTYSKPSTVYPSTGHSDVPKVAVDEEGTVHVVYSEGPSGREGPYELRYTRNQPGDAGFEDPKTLDASVTSNYASFDYPSLSLDEQGDPFILWELYPEVGRRRSKALGLIFSEDGGKTFGAPYVVPGTVKSSKGFNGSLQGKLMEKLDAGDDGQIAVVNSKMMPPDSSRIRLYRATVK
jgi:hypothetical protein